MTAFDIGHISRLAELAKLVFDGVITSHEAFARVGADHRLLAGVNVSAMAEACWEVARTMRHPGCLMTGLIHEWTVAHAVNDPAAIVHSGKAFVRAATEVLMARDDSALYRRAQEAADRMIATAEPEAVWYAHYIAGCLHLAPYALDPVTRRDDYNLGRYLRVQRERWAWPIRGDGVAGPSMPEPAVGLGRAVHHLAVAAERTTGMKRGAALAHLALAEYSRYLANGSGSLADVDSWCDAAAGLMPPMDGDTLGCVRLLWLYALRGRADQLAKRAIPVGPLDEIPNGLMYSEGYSRGS